MRLQLVVDERETPAGTFRAVRTVGPTAQDRNGQPYYEIRSLATTEGCDAVFEVQFADGVRMLVKAEDLCAGPFHLDGVSGEWVAADFGPNWNGWATPIVSRAVLEDVVTSLGEEHHWVGLSVVIGDDDLLRPRSDGLFDLGGLGWRLERGPS